MKWTPFAILAVLTVVIQTTLAHMIKIGGVWPDLMFVVTVHYALAGTWPDAAIAAWILGLLTDLMTSHPNQVGLHAFMYGAAATVILRIRQAVFREHYLTQLVLTFLFAFMVQLPIQLYFRWRGGAEIGILAATGVALGAAIYTAICAPYLHWLLLKMRRWTGLGAREPF